MSKHCMIAARMTILSFVVTGILYPLFVTALAQMLFPRAANGSLLQDEGGVRVGSELIGQAFLHPAYFQPRPSAAGTGYAADASGGSNLGPTSEKLKALVSTRIEALRRSNPRAPALIPDALLTSSASGLDPHLPPAAAFWQIERIAAARGVPSERVRLLIEESLIGRDYGFLGEPRVNVLLLNLALDRQFGRPR